MEKNTATQTAQQFVVDSRTLGKLPMLGLVAVLTDQDENGRVTIKELTGPNVGRETEGISAGSIERISNKPGTAKNLNDKDESELQMARRLSGRDNQRPRQQDTSGQRQDDPYLYSGHKPYGASTKITLKPDGFYYLRVSRVDGKKGLRDVGPRFVSVSDGSKTATRRDKSEISGQYYSYEEFRIEYGDEGANPTESNE